MNVESLFEKIDDQLTLAEMYLDIGDLLSAKREHKAAWDLYTEQNLAVYDSEGWLKRLTRMAIRIAEVDI